jgi:starch-binding outer membrane protein, SusD/RagB family
LPITNGNAAALNNVVRAHRNAAIALKTRVYLAMNRWADVITEANKIVSTNAPFRAATGVVHSLNDDISKTFAAPYTTPESIFSFPFSDVDQPGIQNSLALYWAAAPIGNSEYTVNVTRNVGIAGDTTNFPVTDARRRMLVRIGTTVHLNGKFPTGPINTDFVPIIRYAEVLLNLSEAITRNTNTVDARAIALLNAIRNRSDASVTFTAANFADATALRNAIWIERRIELMGEGFRTFDINRNLLPFPAKTGAPALPVNADNYVYPIPNSELALNKLIKQ